MLRKNISNLQICQFKKLVHVRGQVTNATSINTNAEISDNETTVRPFSEVPTESKLKFLRRFLPGGKNHGSDFTVLLDNLSEEYGKIFLMPSMLGRPQAVITNSPSDHELVFRNDGIWPKRAGVETMKYYRTEYRKDFFQDVQGLITSQGKEWSEFRTAVNPALMQPRNTKLYIQKLSEVNMEFIERIKKRRDKETLEVPDDFESDINRWTLESISLVAVDKKLNLLRDNETDQDAYALRKALESFFVLGVEVDIKPSMWRWISTPKFREIMNAYDTILRVTSKFVDEAVEKLEEQKKQGIQKPPNEESILEKLVKVDNKVAKVMAMDMLFAGVDTASTTLAGILLNLSKHPEKQEKLREEVLKILPEKDSKFTENSFEQMPYLKACIKESQRIYPLVPVNDRVTENDLVLSGYQIPKGTEIFMATRAATRDPEYFVRPDEYLPERWLRKQIELKPKNAFAFLPFGFGPRTCIGKRLVDLELEIALARIIRHFKIEYNYSTDNAFKTHLISVPAIPLKFKFSDIDF